MMNRAMRQAIFVLGLIVVVAIVGGGLYWYVHTSQAALPALQAPELRPGRAGALQAVRPTRPPAAGGIPASGFIEAEEVVISPEVGGQVKAVYVDEGDEVTEGQVLIELDTRILAAQIAQAQAAVESARANLARVKAGARQEEIAAAQAAVRAAKAQVTIAEKAVAAAEANLAIAKAGEAAAQAALDEAQAAYQEVLAGPTERELELARLAIEQAKNQLWAAQGQRDAVGGLKEQFGGEAYTGQYEAAKGQVAVAETAVKIAQVQYEQLKEGPREEEKAMALARVKAAQAQVEQAKAQVLAAEVAVEQAQAQVEAAEAGLAQAEAKLALLMAGPTREEVAIAEAKVKEAEAALGILQVQRDKMTLRAPRSGLVIARAVNEGETAAPGAALLTIADLDNLTLTVYIPEVDIGRVRVGQEVEVSVDAYPGRKFKGEVVFIASKAEFTPKNVQTREERAKLVFAVKVRIPNPEHLLKPGMPADALIR